MKKNLLLVLSLLIAGGVFAQEYTLYFSGDLRGYVTITKDTGGRITLAIRLTEPKLFSGAFFKIDAALCPLLPKNAEFYVTSRLDSVVIDGNTTTWTDSDGSRSKKVVNGNTTTTTMSDGSWIKEVVNGNTTTTTSSNGSSYKDVVNGNTTTRISPDGRWISKTVVNGNTTTETYSWGDWVKDVVNGNTTTRTSSFSDDWTKTVVNNQGRNVFIEITSGRR